MKYKDELKAHDPERYWYLEMYEDIFSDLDPNEEYKILEIGVLHGKGMWALRESFPNSDICGIDIKETYLIPELTLDEKTKLIIGSQVDTKFLDEMIDMYKEFDIIIDDGSHMCDHQKDTFEYLFPHLKPGKSYVIEDTHTSYWERYRGGFENEDSFIEYCKGLVDSIHEWTYTEPFTRLYGDKTLPRTKINDNIKHWIKSINFYSSSIVIDKRQTERIDKRPSAKQQ